MKLYALVQQKDKVKQKLMISGKQSDGPYLAYLNKKNKPKISVLSIL